MFKEILKALRRTDALSEMIAQVGAMLDTGKWMFEQASEALMRDVDWSAIADPLYAKDREINEIEQRVRERIVTYLSLGRAVDLSACAPGIYCYRIAWNGGSADGRIVVTR